MSVPVTVNRSDYWSEEQPVRSEVPLKTIHKDRLTGLECSPFLQFPDESPETCLFLLVLEIHKPACENDRPSKKSSWIDVMFQTPLVIRKSALSAFHHDLILFLFGTSFSIGIFKMITLLFSSSIFNISLYFIITNWLIQKSHFSSYSIKLQFS